jgi:hypothetical protein
MTTDFEAMNAVQAAAERVPFANVGRLQAETGLEYERVSEAADALRRAGRLTKRLGGYVLRAA